MIQTVELKSSRDYDGRFPPEPIGDLIRHLPKVAKKAVSMAFRRRSTVRGRQPDWLTAASDLRLVDIRGTDAPCLHFDAPQLATAAPEIYQQEELFPARPEPDDTAIDVVCLAIQDVAQNNADSDRFDEALLRALSDFTSIVNGQYQQIHLRGRRSPVVLDRQVIHSAEEMKARTPPPTPARVAGVLDAVKISNRTFDMRLDGGEEIKGVMSASELDRALEMFASKQRVLVRGQATFRPSQQLRLIEAESIEPGTDESGFWSQVPQPAEADLQPETLRRRQGPRSGLAAVVGKWPGDESDEEIEKSLRELR